MPFKNLGTFHDLSRLFLYFSFLVHNAELKRGPGAGYFWQGRHSLLILLWILAALQKRFLARSTGGISSFGRFRRVCLVGLHIIITGCLSASVIPVERSWVAGGEAVLRCILERSGTHYD